MGASTPAAPSSGAGRRTDETWESSHVGGDRFAANLVCLPHGLHYGHVQPNEAARLVERYEAGAVDLAHLRGRASSSMGVQAAEWFARRQTGILGLDELRPIEVVTPDDESATVTFATASGSVVVAVRERTADVARVTSCADPNPDRPTEWRLERLEVDA
jgi:hypothetical protein